MKRAIPLALAVSAFGASFGTLAVDAGMTAPMSILMSALVFAGSAQYAAVEIASAGAGTIGILTSVALLNARYLPVGIALSPAIRGRLPSRLILAHLVVDETWAVSFEDGEPQTPLFVGSGLTILVAWVVGTGIGSYAGDVIDPKVFGFDVAFPAVFLGYLARRSWNTRALLATATGVGAFALTTTVPAGMTMLIAGLAGLIVGMTR